VSDHTYENALILYNSPGQYPRDSIYDEYDLGSQYLHYEQQQREPRFSAAGGPQPSDPYALSYIR